MVKQTGASNTKMQQSAQQEAPQAQQQAQLPPKPKFEFYTLLEKGEKATPKTAPANKSAPATQQTAPVTTAAITSQAAVQQARSSHHPELVKVAEGKPLPPVSKSNYIIQVASFKARQDADRMKGLLILKGFAVTVVPVATPNKGNWFRVLVGPYPNRELAKNAQFMLARNEHLNGMIRTGR